MVILFLFLGGSLCSRVLGDDMLGLQLGSDVPFGKTDRRDGRVLQVASFVALLKIGNDARQKHVRYQAATSLSP